MDRSEPWASPNGAPRSRIDLLALILLPLIANVILAVVIWTHLPTGASAGANIVPDPIPIGPVVDTGSTLPVSNVNEIISHAELATGHQYACSGPWGISGGLKWACRTTDSLIVIVASRTSKAFLVDGTWFGFDRTATDLPAWAAAVQQDESLANAMRAWAEGRVGSVDSTTIGGVDLRAGGARGAFSLVIEAH